MDNKNNKIVRAKKEYKCSNCGNAINIGDKYRRLNILGLGIYHFCLECNKDYKKILEDKFMDYIEYVYKEDIHESTLDDLAEEYLNEAGSH